MGQSTIMMIVLGIFILAFGVYYLYNKSKQANGSNQASASTNNTKNTNVSGIKRVDKEVPRGDMSSFMHFDKIANDMIYQKNGERYTMVIECKGINYELMSEIEQMAVEEGFVTFLNTLKFPIQLYVQTRSVDLGENIKVYKERVKQFADMQSEATAKYNEAEDDIDVPEEEILRLKQEKVKYTNIAEYVNDITRYVERMALNKYMLQRKFYVIISYNKSEIATTEKFTKEEYEDLCYRELYTRAQGIIGSLVSCSVQGRILSSNELAQLIYISLNKDDERAMDIKKALDAGFYRLYTTSDDVREKRKALIDEQIRQESLRRIEDAVREGIEKGTIIPEDQMADMMDKEIDKRAIKIVEKSELKPEVKQEVKNIISDNRKKKLQAKAEQKKNEKSEKNSDETVQEKNVEPELNDSISEAEDKNTADDEIIS